MGQLNESHSPRSNTSELIGEAQIKSSNKVGISKHSSSTDKSTSAVSSVTSTPPLLAARAPNEKKDDMLTLSNKSLSIRVTQEICHEDEEENAFVQSTQPTQAKRGRK